MSIVPFGQILRRFVWLCALVFLAACSGPREATSDYGQFRAKLDGDDVLVEYIKDIRWVRQSAPNLCWAASLEQALDRQGVELDQQRILQKFYPESDEKEGRTSNLLQWYLSPVFSDRIRDGSEVWIRLVVDHHDYEMYRYDFVSEIADELSANRVPLVGISTGFGEGHVVTVIGAAYPIDSKWLTTWRIVGFLVYDPLTAKPYLVSANELYRKSEIIVSVTSFSSQTEAILHCGRSCSRKSKL